MVRVVFKSRYDALKNDIDSIWGVSRFSNPEGCKYAKKLLKRSENLRYSELLSSVILRKKLSVQFFT